MLKPSLQLKLGQQLTMTPQLQQAIRLLQLPALELQAHIRELLETNVMLEPLDEGESENGSEGELPEAAERGESAAANESSGEAEAASDGREATVEVLEEDWGGARGSGESAWNGEDDDRQQDIADAAGQSLQDYLLWQIELARLAPRELAIARTLVDAVNDDGYLIESLEDLLETLKPDANCTVEEIEAVLYRVQALDPAGVFARSIGECIELQLRQLDQSTPGMSTAVQIARHHLERLAGRDLAALKRELHTSEEDLAEALALVRSCHPRPGATVSTSAPQYVIPDVFVRRSDHGWIVEINSATLPRVRLNQGYANLLGRSASHASLRAQLQEARWLMKSLEIRHETLIKVSRSIVQRQVCFLEQGEEHMRPMILKDIAEAVGMHESTISRVTSGKYMHTPRGVFELRYFFSSQIEGADGSGTSSTAIRAKIRKLVKEEDSLAPLSDGRIAELLCAEGIPVARRTVAKYREALNIPSSGERKRCASAPI